MDSSTTPTRHAISDQAAPPPTAMAAAAASSQQLLDSLTAHLSLYHTSNPNPSPSPSPSSPRAALLRWLAALPPPARRAAATVVSAPFASCLLAMLRRLRLRGHGLFFLLPDGGDPPSPLFRLSRGLLSRAAALHTPSLLLFSHLLLFSSRDHPPAFDAVTVSEVLLADLGAFVAAMDAVSGGKFLCCDVDAAALSSDHFPELPWLKEKGYYSIEAFAANRLEIALRLSWMAAVGGGGGRKGARIGRAVKEKAGVAANAFWRKKGCLDWWARLEQRDRARLVEAFMGTAAKKLANEIVEGSNDASREEFCFFIGEAGSSLPAASFSECTRQSFFRRNRPGQLHSMRIRSSKNEPVLAKQLEKLIVVQEIASVMRKIGQYDAESLFFTTLASAGTIADYVLVKLRRLLMLISTDCTNLELIGDGTPKIPPKKVKEKAGAGSRKGKKKCSNPKKLTSTSKLSKDHGCGSSESKSSSVCSNLQVPSGNDTVSSVLRESPDKAIAPVLLNQELILGFSDSKSQCNKKKNKRRGKTKLSNVVRDEIPESAKMKTSFSTVAAENSSSLKESIDDVPLDLLPHDRTHPQVLSCSDSCNRPTGIDGNSMQNSTNREEESCSPRYSSLTTSEYSGNLLKSDTSSTNDSSISDTNQLESVSRKSSSLPSRDDNICSTDLYRHSADSLVCSAEKKTECDITNPVLHTIVPDVSIINEECEQQNSTMTQERVLSSVIPINMLQGALNDNSPVMKKDGSDYYVYNRNTLGGTSYEWPSITPPHFVYPELQQRPAATDRLHLDVGYRWPTQLDQSLFPASHRVRNSTMEAGCSQMLPSSALPLSFDWPPVLRGCNRYSQNSSLNYDSIYTPRMQSSAWSGFPPQVMQRSATCSEKDRKCFGDGDLRNTSDFGDDTESFWFSEEESESHAFSGSDYNQYFGGGVMYWSPAEHAGTGFSRPPSHSSDDSAWAWHEANVSRVVDDLASGIPTSCNANGVPSPPTTPFYSRNESLDPLPHSVGYSMAGDINGNVLNSTSLVQDSPEDQATLPASNSSCTIEAVKGDTLPYSMLRPLVVPGISRRGSRSEFKGGHDHRSPCVPSTRRDLPRVRRPLSPVVLSVPRVPRPPPPVGESRKRGFPIVRSGSSSPRHWGMRSLFCDDKISDRVQLCLDGPEVVWPSWGSKGTPAGTLAQSIEDTVLQDHLIKISQLSRDQQHPDVALPLQPPDMSNSSSRKASLSLMHNVLHEEIDHFCKQVAAGNLMRKPYVNWAVKRVTRCLQVLWPRSRTNLFGSNATGLALPTSDVDLVVSLPPVRNLEPIKEAGILEGRNGIKETCLQHAARYLANQDWVRSDSLKTVENTAIPVIMLVAEVPCDTNLSNDNSSVLDSSQEHSANVLGEQGSPLHSDSSEGSTLFMCSKMNKDDADVVQLIRLDISFKSPSHTGLQTSELVRELTQQFPASVPLALILKKFLADRSLDHSYAGGLSSYCLVLLITRFLQHEHHLGQPISQNLGSLLMDFLYFFGNVFDPRQMRISIQGSGIYMNRERGHSIDPIHIDDPLCPINNVGRNCFRIHQCIKAFADAFAVLENEIGRSSGDRTLPASSFSLLRKIIPSIDCDD